MEELLLSILLTLNKWQDIKDVPAEVPGEWVSENSWANTPNGIVFEASSDSIANECKENPNGFLQFPVVLYGAQEITLDGTRTIRFGHPKMDQANYVVSAPVIQSTISKEAQITGRFDKQELLAFFHAIVLREAP